MIDGAEAFADGRDVSRETLERLRIYADLLRKWNPRINLVSPGTIDGLWTRHFLDSAQLIDLVPDAPATWADLGSGGGFPGLVVAIFLHDQHTTVTLVESDQRKATFLRTVARETGTTVNVLSARIEAVKPLGASVLTARALSPLPDLLIHCNRHLAPGGTALLPKGARADAEIAKALETWSFHCEKVPSQTDDSAVILRITEIEGE
ncbi:MAG: 16S rRNA (guanine(527)-N(7))-methyltransferase RsmG [Pseudomonadota bacterium]